MKPNKERIKKWVEALLSGEYEQTALSLRDGKGYCCLGVACDVSEIGDWNEEGEYVIEGIREHESLPPNVASWYGLESDPLLYMPTEGFKTPATSVNDEFGYTFEEIAFCIRATYLREEE